MRLEYRMAEFKNLKLPIGTHDKVVSRANALGMKKYVLAEVLINLGLQNSDREIQEAVVKAQLGVTPLGDCTNQEPSTE